MNKAPKVIGVVAIFLLAGLVGYAGWAGWISPSRGQMLGGEFSISTSSEAINASAFLGTHVGTTTIGVDKNGGATTSYRVKIGQNVNTAIINFKLTAATSTNSLAVAVLGSNDFNCSTNLGNGAAATNTVMDNINWYSVSDHARGRVHSTSLLNSSTPWHWTNGTVGAGTEIILTDLAHQCLRIDVSGLSTTVFGEITTKK